MASGRPGLISRVSSMSQSPGPSLRSGEVSPTSSMGSPKNRKREIGSLGSHDVSPLLSDEGRLDSYFPERGVPENGFEVDGEEKSKSVFYLFILTLGIGGLQIAWSVETSNGSPFLLSLGMSKSLLALVWIAGPLGGVLVQPYVGIRSDNCRLAWGKRRPFMIAGALSTAFSFLALGWSREIVHGVLGIFGADAESHGVQVMTIIWATVFVYILDFAINAVQAAIRAFIVDNAPTHQQEAANAWAGRITGVGNILGYFAGNKDLPKYLPWLGKTQMQVLCSIAAIAICFTVAVSSVYVQERNPQLEGPPKNGNPGVISFFRQTYEAIVRLPVQIRRVCEAQFFNWLGWFGFLFYQTTYIGQIYCNPRFDAHPDMSPAEVDKTWEAATRVGTKALLVFAFTSFISNMLLPFFVTPSYEPPTSKAGSVRSGQERSNADLSASLTSFSSRPAARETHARLSRLLNIVQIPGLTLRRAWFLSHILFALCMISTFFITTVTAATIQTAIIGIPWAISMWAPFALISAEISKRDAEARRRGHSHPSAEKHDQAGVILGLHNVAVSAPQILATLIGSAIFKAVQKPRGAAWDESTAWVMRFGGFAALAAAFFTWRVFEEKDLAMAKRRGHYERVRSPRDEEEP